MFTYTVWYKEVSDKNWKKLDKVEADGLIPEVQTRFFMLQDNSRYEIPTAGMIFKFSPDRAEILKKADMENPNKENATQ